MNKIDELFMELYDDTFIGSSKKADEERAKEYAELRAARKEAEISNKNDKVEK